MLSFQSAPHAATSSASQPGLLARLGRRVRQSLCGLHGHDALLHFGPDRVSLLCTSCGYESPGWEVRATPPRATPPPVEPTRRVVQLPVPRERRVA